MGLNKTVFFHRGWTLFFANISWLFNYNQFNLDVSLNIFSYCFTKKIHTVFKKNCVLSIDWAAGRFCKWYKWEQTQISLADIFVCHYSLLNSTVKREWNSTVTLCNPNLNECHSHKLMSRAGTLWLQHLWQNRNLKWSQQKSIKVCTMQAKSCLLWQKNLFCANRLQRYQKHQPPKNIKKNNLLRIPILIFSVIYILNGLDYL